MDLSQVLSKPIIVIQTSENVTKLIGALLRYRTPYWGHAHLYLISLKCCKIQFLCELGNL